MLEGVQEFMVAQQTAEDLARRRRCVNCVNTLMLQQVLAQPKWTDKLTARDLAALTPLIWEHVNPYGRFELDMIVAECPRLRTLRDTGQIIQTVISISGSLVTPNPVTPNPATTGGFFRFFRMASG
jgi:hypothetical protein